MEATGDPEAIATAVAACADGGRIILLGSSRGAGAELPLPAMRRKRLELIGAHISALPGESRRAGADWLRELGDGFLSALAEQRVRVDDLAGDRLDPREPERFYRSLAADATARVGVARLVARSVRRALRAERNAAAPESPRRRHDRERARSLRQSRSGQSAPM